MKRVLFGLMILRGFSVVCGFGAVLGWFGWWASGELKGWGLLVLVVLMPTVFGGALLGVGGVWLHRRRKWPRVLVTVGAVLIAGNLLVVAWHAIFDCPFDLLSGFERHSNSCVDYATQSLPIAAFIAATIYVGIAVWFLQRQPVAT